MSATHQILRKYSRILLLILALAFTGCSAGQESQNSSGQPSGKAMGIGLITGEKGIEALEYQKAWAGLQKAKQELQTEVFSLKAKNEKEMSSRLKELAKKDVAMVFTLGSEAVPSVLIAAKDNPGIQYVCLEAEAEGTIPKNVLVITYKVEEAAFLAGYLAGEMTKTDVIGFISEDNKDLAQRTYYGFKAGLRSANDYTEFMKGLTGATTTKSRLKEMANSMVHSKADVIFAVAGSGNVGMIEVMEREEKYAIGFANDQAKEATEAVLTSVLIHHDHIIYQLIEEHQTLGRGSLSPQKRVYGLAEKAVGIVEPSNARVSQPLLDRLAGYEKAILEGKWSVPINESTYLSFKPK